MHGSPFAAENHHGAMILSGEAPVEKRWCGPTQGLLNAAEGILALPHLNAALPGPRIGTGLPLLPFHFHDGLHRFAKYRSKENRNPSMPRRARVLCQIAPAAVSAFSELHLSSGPLSTIQHANHCPLERPWEPLFVAPALRFARARYEMVGENLYEWVVVAELAQKEPQLLAR